MWALFIVAPLLASLVLGWNRMNFLPHVTRLASTLYWAGLVLTIWLAAIVGMLLVHAATRRWRWPLWALALVGAVAGVIIFYWPIAYYRHFGLAFTPAAFRGTLPPLPWPTLDYLPRLATNTLPGIMYWTIAAWAASRMFERQTHTGVTDTTGPSADVPLEAVLRSRLPAHLDGEILALKAEDHYVRVYTAKGDTLVHHRFRDAVRELGSTTGLQVHRSFWVRRAAITRRYSDGHNHFLRLSNDLRVPVSRAYLHAVRSAR